MNDTLQFLETWSIARFKQLHNISTINIVKNPHSGKVFFTCPDDSTVSGKVSKKEGWQDNPAISKCTDLETGKVFFMLHKRNESNANVLATL